MLKTLDGRVLSGPLIQFERLVDGCYAGSLHANCADVPENIVLRFLSKRTTAKS